MIEPRHGIHPEITLVTKYDGFSVYLSAMDQRRAAKRSPTDEYGYVIDLVDDQLPVR